jgi:hypothetical protein
MVRAEGYVDLEGKNSKESDQLAFSSCVPHRSLKS